MQGDWRRRARHVWELFTLGWPGAVLLAILAVIASGCGDSATTTSSSATGTEDDEPYRGGEKSIEEFGEEAGGSERAALLAAFHGYLGALAERDPVAACSYLTASAQRSVAEILRDAKQASCEKALPALLSPTAPAVAREQDEGRITKVRVEGNRGFIVFHAPGAKLYQMTMENEGGEWKTTTVATAVLVPQL